MFSWLLKLISTLKLLSNYSSPRRLLDLTAISTANYAAMEHSADWSPSNVATTKPVSSSPNATITSGHKETLQIDFELKREEVILAPYTYIAGLPGKGVREKLIAAVNIWYHVPKPQLQHISDVVSMLHTASLLLDDIQDDSEIRRGHPAAHVKYGTALTINAATYVFVLSGKLVNTMLNRRSQQMWVEELSELHRGQGLDIHWRENLLCPTEAEYLYMVEQKTGGLFRLIMRLLQSESPSHSHVDCSRLATLLGQYFQVRDDYMNLKSATYTSQKGFCEDLEEGKFSLMVLHALRARPDDSDETILKVLRASRERKVTHEMKLRVLEFLEETGSFEYALAFLRNCAQEIRTEVAKLVEQTGRENGPFDVVFGMLEVR